MAASCAKSLDTKKEAAISAARRLGYRNFKHEQMKVVFGFLSRRDVNQKSKLQKHNLKQKVYTNAIHHMYIYIQYETVHSL